MLVLKCKKRMQAGPAWVRLNAPSTNMYSYEQHVVLRGRTVCSARPCLVVHELGVAPGIPASVRSVILRRIPQTHARYLEPHCLGQSLLMPWPAGAHRPSILAMQQPLGQQEPLVCWHGCPEDPFLATLPRPCALHTSGARVVHNGGCNSCSCMRRSLALVGG